MRSQRTRVCYLIPSYYPLVGGAEIQLGGLLGVLDRDRFSPFVLTRRLPGTRSVDLAENTPIVRCAAPLRPATFFFSSLRYLWKRRKEFDVVHVYSFDSPALAGAIIKRLFPEKRFIQRIPRFGPGSAFARLTHSIPGRIRLRFILRQADAIIPLCPEATAALADTGLTGANIAQIPNGVDTGFFTPATSREKQRLKVSFGIQENAFVAILVARLIPRKNVKKALEMWGRVVKSHPGSVLIVAGSGPDMSHLAEYAEANFNGRRVVFTGNTSRDELSRLMKTADVYLSCSDSEGMSNAMLEACSAGLPVVAGQGPGIDQLVEHAQTGFLFDAEKPAEGVDYLLRLAEDRELISRMSLAARNATVEGYAFDSIARDIEGLYANNRKNNKEPEPAVPATITKA